MHIHSRMLFNKHSESIHDKNGADWNAEDILLVFFGSKPLFYDWTSNQLASSNLQLTHSLVPPHKVLVCAVIALYDAVIVKVTTGGSILSRIIMTFVWTNTSEIYSVIKLASQKWGINHCYKLRFFIGVTFFSFIVKTRNCDKRKMSEVWKLWCKSIEALRNFDRMFIICEQDQRSASSNYCIHTTHQNILYANWNIDKFTENMHCIERTGDQFWASSCWRKCFTNITLECILICI